jgi:hypothetical protein
MTASAWRMRMTAPGCVGPGRLRRTVPEKDWQKSNTHAPGVLSHRAHGSSSAVTCTGCATAGAMAPPGSAMRTAAGQPLASKPGAFQPGVSRRASYVQPA